MSSGADLPQASGQLQATDLRISTLPRNLRYEMGLDASGGSGAANAAAWTTYLATAPAADYYLPSGTYTFDGSAVATPLDIPKLGQFKGAGQDATTINVRNGAYLRGGKSYADVGSSTSAWNNAANKWTGGEIGGFTVDGGHTQPVLLYLGRGNQRSFRSITFQNAGVPTGTQAAVQAEYCQNHWWSSVIFTGNYGWDLVMDKGAGGWRVRDCEFTSGDIGSLWLPGTVKETGLNGPYADVVQDVTFERGFMERSGSNGGPASTIATVNIEGGDRVFFNGLQLSDTQAPFTQALLRIRTVQAGVSCNVYLANSTASGSQSGSTLVDAMSTNATAITLRLDNWRPKNHQRGYVLDDNCRVIHQSEPNYVGIPSNYYVAQNGGVKAEADIFTAPRRASAVTFAATTPTNTLVFGSTERPTAGTLAQGTDDSLWMLKRDLATWKLVAA